MWSTGEDMSRFGLRKFIIRTLNGSLPPDPHDEEEEDGEGRGEISAMYVMGPDGPVAVEPGGAAPPGMPPHLAQMLGLSAGHPPQPRQHRTDPGVNPSKPPTIRAGPASPGFSMRVLDCSSVMDPTGDPEVQFLLSAGWEPFGVHKFSSITGVQGVRLYFKRGVTGGPNPIAEG
jgi:hypothetical protein